MNKPFPGMDPYLEHPWIWPSVHTLLIGAMQLAIAGHVAPKYYVSIEERTYISIDDPQSFVGRPDVAIMGTPQLESAGGVATLSAPVMVQTPMSEEIRERYLEIRTVGDDQVITVIDLLSPTNKRPGRGRDDYAAKRQDVLASWTNLVEIDLLRGGLRPAIEPPPASHYYILVSRRPGRPNAQLYPFNVTDAIPPFRVPWQRGDDEPELALGALLAELYQQAHYDLRLDYSKQPEPPLAGDYVEWLDEMLREAGLR